MIRTSLKRAVVASTFGLTVALMTGNWMATGARAFTAQTAPTGQTAEKTVDEARKNIQVLKGLPDSQLLPMMNLISASLGVTCLECHVRTGNQWEWEKDDKNEKKTARKMIQMTMDLNKNSFGGRPQVTCFTCHQGHSHPTGVPSLPQPQRGPAVPPAQAQTRPAAPDVLATYVRAVGGKEIGENLRTRVIKGSFVGVDGNAWPAEVRLAGSDKLLAVLSAPQIGPYSYGFNGTEGWVKNAREQRAMTGPELNNVKSLAWSFEALKLKEPYPNLNFGGVEKIGERDAYVFRTTTADRKRVRFYFDTQSGLLLRRVVLTDTIIGQDPEQIDFEDYRDVGSAKLPFTIRTLYLDNRLSGTWKLTEIKPGGALDDTQFNPPR